jgi:hypothetical protein
VGNAAHPGIDADTGVCCVFVAWCGYELCTSADAWIHEFSDNRQEHNIETLGTKRPVM